MNATVFELTGLPMNQVRRSGRLNPAGAFSPEGAKCVGDMGDCDDEPKSPWTHNKTAPAK